MEIKTIVDKIYEEIKRRGKVKASELVKKFDVDYLTIEEWMEELESRGMVKIIYPSSPFGDVIFYSWEEWENESSRRKKSRS